MNISVTVDSKSLDLYVVRSWMAGDDSLGVDTVVFGEDKARSLFVRTCDADHSRVMLCRGYVDFAGIVRDGVIMEEWHGYSQNTEAEDCGDDSEEAWKRRFEESCFPDDNLFWEEDCFSEDGDVIEEEGVSC